MTYSNVWTSHFVHNSLQLGLANYLDVPVHLVYEKFEEVGGCFCSVFVVLLWLTSLNCNNAETLLLQR
jgi:hypothetical protein